jgi:hypothetical protein
MINAYKIVVGKPKEKGSNDRLLRILLKWILKKRCKSVDWILLAQDRDK